MRPALSRRWQLVRTALLSGLALSAALWVAARAVPPRESAGQPLPTLADFWAGRASWVLEIPDTGLPVGESDTIYRGGGEYWSYLHASTQSAGVLDSCGDRVEFPGCVTRWVSTDGGRTFALAEPTCLIKCNVCPCDGDDGTWQQQYPRVAAASGGGYYMAFEHGAQTWITFSFDGIRWRRPHAVPYTGVWMAEHYPCPDYMRIGPHPFVSTGYECMAGAPPGIFIEGVHTYLFLGMGQNPGHLGCYRASTGSLRFQNCSTNPLLSAVAEYGPPGALGASANPYFNFRYITSADLIAQDGYYYMAYEGIRGPSGLLAGRDDQFALGFARATSLEGPWVEYPGNPVLDNVTDNWGIGHADLLVVDGQVIMYTATPALARGRYVLRFN